MMVMRQHAMKPASCNGKTQHVSLRSPQLPVASRALVIRRFKEGERDGVERARDAIENKNPTQRLDQEGVPKNKGELQDAMRAGGRQPRDMAPPVSPLQPAFLRKREVSTGRIAMVGFLAACFWESVLPGHPGMFLQVAGFTGLSPNFVFSALTGLVLYNTVGALAPWSPTYSTSNLLDVAQRPKGPPTVLTANPAKILGITAWGFTKANEVFSGRLAMLGFVAAVMNEIRSGGAGPLAQIAMWLNVPASENFYAGVDRGFGIFVVLAIVLAWVDGLPGWQADREDDIY